MGYGLVPFLELELKRRKWKKADLIQRSELKGSTVYGVFNNPDKVPETETLYRLASALDIHWTVLAELCGYPAETPGPNMTLEELARMITAEIPQLGTALQQTLLLDAPDRDVLFAIAQAYWRILRAERAQADR